MARFTDTDYLHPDEREAAVAIRKAAQAVHHLFYYSYAGDELPDATKEMLTRLYRGLRIATLHYFEEDEVGLLWTAPPPGKPFTKASK